MKMEKLNTTLTLTANIGVLIGLFLVAYELRQNDDSLNASIQLSISSSYEELATFGIEYPQLQQSIVQVYMNPEELSNEQLISIMAWQYRYLMVLHTTYGFYLDGIVSEAFWREKASHFTVYLAQSAKMKEIYDMAKHDQRRFLPHLSRCTKSCCRKCKETCNEEVFTGNGRLSGTPPAYC